MPTNINQYTITDYTPIEISYTDKDYTNILDDLINSIGSITQKWNTSDENDVGIVLVKLMAILGDMLFYNQDVQALEVYPNSVTQRKNAQAIYKLIGYKMRWYKSAMLSMNIVNTYTNSATIPRFCTFTTKNQSVTYCTTKQYEVPSNTTNNGTETLIELIQGTPVTPVRVSNSPYPEVGKAWHSIYGYNYTTADIINNRLYLKHQNIDQDHIILVDDSGEEWILKNNIYLTTDVGRFFEFGVDVNDQPYLELVDYYNNFDISKFKVFYIRSNGESGQIYANTLTKVSGNVWSRAGNSVASTIYNVSNFIKFTHYDSTYGYDPETPDEARKNSSYYVNTLDTIITLADFERATMREVGVANVRATDLTNDPGVQKTFYLGDINMDGVIDEDDYTTLANYIADPIGHPLTANQLKLADMNQDGILGDSADLACLRAYLDNKPDMGAGTISPEDLAKAGYTGAQTVSFTELLDGFVVKLYILRTSDYDNSDEDLDESYINMIKSDLQEYKILPLTIEVDLYSINKYYWSVKGTFLTKEPISRDDLQSIIVAINNDLRYNYAPDKVNFNTVINYKDVIETILAVDNRILMVDLDPITYINKDGEAISKEQLTGRFKQYTKPLDNPDPAENLHYTITLENAPILPGSIMVRLDNGLYTLRDNNNGEIFNSDGILQHKGSVDYVTGEVDIELTSPTLTDIIIDYTHNATNIATYRNLNTEEFYFNPESLIADDIKDTL